MSFVEDLKSAKPIVVASSGLASVLAATKMQLMTPVEKALLQADDHVQYDSERQACSHRISGLMQDHASLADQNKVLSTCVNTTLMRDLASAQQSLLASQCASSILGTAHSSRKGTPLYYLLMWFAL